MDKKQKKQYQKFYELDIWKEGYELQKEVFALTQTFPREERYGLGSQLNDSSNSVIANIAESHGRFYYADKIRVLYTVRGELEETQSHLIVAQSRGYIPREKTVELVRRYEHLKQKLNGYINDFSKRKKEQD